MKRGFSKTYSIKLPRPITEAFLYTVRDRIERKYDIPYITEITPTGFTMIPKFKLFSTQRNSFWPEINAERADSPDTYLITCRPPHFVRLFMKFWFSFFAFMEAFILLLSKGSIDLMALAPIYMMLMGYFITKLATHFSANKIIDMILCRNL